MALITCATEIGKYIVTELGWPFLKTHVDYWWHFDHNIQQLRDGIRDLDRETFDIIQKIEGARLRTEILRSGVEDWAKAGTEKIAEARSILQDIDIPKAWNLISRYSMGRSARKTTEEIAKHLKDGNFGTIADSAPPAAMGSVSQRQIMDFESRKRIEEEVMESLRNSSISTIAICGMGGVGKTSMVEKIRKRVREENLFDEVAMVVVSQQVDMLKIQKEIAEWLRLKFEAESMPVRAQELSTRLMDTKRKIIIFDDVWKSLNFEELGIPFDFERCKILLTSRSTDICKGNRNKKVHEMHILKEGEAWNLFKENAGNCIEDPNLRPLAEKVVAECKGLPIALVTVGKALEDEKDKHKWEFAISQLNNPTDFQEVVTDVYNPLKLSYDFLKNENEKFLFLLCCLFPEDYNISVEELTWYITGLGKFDGIYSIKDARIRTHVLVENLKKRSLLIDGRNELYVKMHDVVRDVAIYIGSEERKGFLKSLKNPSKENSSDVNCRWMSVDISNKPMEDPVAWRFPNLRLLMLLKFSYEEFSNISFEGMPGLNVLSFSSTSISSLPPTLTNLQTLSLFDCEVKQISIIGELRSLEILSFDECPDITELPEEIGKLTRLRLLRLHECTSLETIAFGVISRLVRLEELKIVYCFCRWEAKQTGKARRNASLGELESLSHLTFLEIEIDDWNLASEDMCLSQNLVKYCITINASNYYWTPERGYEKVMNLNLPGNIGVVGNWIQMLVKNTEYLLLEGDGSNNFNIAELENLRKLIFRNCSTMEEQLNKIDRRNLNQDVSLHYLESIEITHCSNLRFLFSVSVARTSLLQLQVLKIESCDKLERVFWNEIRDNRDACLEFPKLKELTLNNLPNLTALCHGLENIIKFPNLTEMWIGDLPKLNSLSSPNSEAAHDDTTSHHFLFNEKVKFGNLKELTLNRMDNITNIWCSQISIDFFNNLEELKISHLNGIRSLMSYSIAKNLVSLKSLEIEECEEVVEVIEGGDDKQVVDIQCLFPALKNLNIDGLPKLRMFWNWNGALELPLLEDVIIRDCPMMETFTLGSLNTTCFHFLFNEKVKFGNLKELTLNRMDNITNIWCSQISIDFFNNLEELKISHLNGIRSLMSYSIAKNLVSLKSLEIEECEEVVEVIECDDDKQVVDILCLFPALKYLEIGGLPKLRMFWKWNGALELPLLEDVIIRDCPMMETFTLGSLNTTCFHFLFNEKVKFGNLKELTLNRMDNITNIWCSQISIDFFNNLEELKISHLNGIRSLMSYSIAKNLVSLKSLEIEECEEVVEVIECDDDKQVVDILCLFPALKYLEIGGLPKLRMFWKWNGALELPLLEDVIIRDCPMMETFTLGSLNTTCFHFLFNEKVKFGNLKKLTLNRMDNITNIWCSQISIDFFNNLEKLKISCLNGIRSLMSYSIAKNLVSLRSLVIDSCEEIVEVIEGDDDKQVVDILCLFPALKYLEIGDLPKLRMFWKWNGALELPLLEDVIIRDCPMIETFTLGSLNTTCFHFLFNEKVKFGNLKELTLNRMDNITNIWCSQISIDFFNNLEELKISHLNGIRSLMSYSIAKNLVSLKYLGISNCVEVVEVIEGGDDKQVVDIQCLFPALKNLRIVDLPKLRMFWKWNGALELPLLELVDIYSCPVMETFTLRSLNTPNIRRIVIEERKSEKDLNHAIRGSSINLDNDNYDNEDVDENEDMGDKEG